MTIEDILKSRSCGLRFNMLLALTEPHSAYPGKTPAPRAGILRRLEAIDAETRDTLDRFAEEPLAGPSVEAFSPPELYMLRQRLHCALDTLSRLADSAPTPGWLSTASGELDAEDRWLFAGVWREFGAFWLQNLAWRLSRGAAE